MKEKHRRRILRWEKENPDTCYCDEWSEQSNLDFLFNRDRDKDIIVEETKHTITFDDGTKCEVYRKCHMCGEKIL